MFFFVLYKLILFWELYLPRNKVPLSLSYFDFSVNGPSFLVVLDLLQRAAAPEPGMGTSQRVTAEENLVGALYTLCNSLTQRRKTKNEDQYLG